ncbi:hypothetical protein cypCar_00001211, partial [Cyprinus carpio]
LEPHTGNISAFVKHTDHSVIKPIALTVKEQGTGRPQWEVLEALIGQLDEPFQVTVQYSSCSSHEVGFLAFDSLELKNCVMVDDYLDLGSDCEKYSSLHCHSGGCIEKRRVCDFHTDCPQGEDEGLICNSLPLGSYCSFELGSCGWSVADSQSSWRLVSGQQLTEDTDLLSTTLQNTQGHFLFLKARGRSEESEALVQTPALPATISNQDCQLQFSLYLYGDFNGTVLLSVLENGMSASPLIWERSGHWKDAWQEITLPITEILKGISAYGAAGGKGAKNHNKRSHGVIISAIFPLEKGDILYILIGHQGEDACPGRNSLTHEICLGESSVIEDGFDSDGLVLKWAGGGGGGGGATYIYRMENGEPVPLLIAAGGGGKAYLEDPESSLDQIFLEQYENDTSAPSVNGKSGAAGGGGGWGDLSSLPWAGKSFVEGGQGGSSCPEALSVLGWATFGGFGGGGGACTAGGGGGGYRGGDVPLLDGITADGQDGVSFVHPMGKIFLQPLAAMESHGEAEIEVYLNCSHCQTQSCKRDEDPRLILCLCDSDEVLAPDNVTCLAVVPLGSLADGPPSLIFILMVIASTVVTGVVLTCASLTLIYYRKKNHLHAVRIRLQSPEYKLSKIRSSTIMTDYNPNYCFAGKAASLSELKEVPRKNITLLRALGHGAFGEVYEGQVLGMNRENTAMQVAIKTLPEICSEQDEMDFLMEALIMSKFSHQNIVRCIGVSLQILPRFILLELMTGGDMKTFLRLNRPRTNQPSSLSMLELLHMARDIALGCRYLEENHFIHRDIAARNCLLTCPGPERVAKIGDFGMARDIYRASYYRKGGRAMLPVKWMPPEAFLEGIFTCKTDTCYRIMTQCWQHCPEHRPNFSTILERINYCTQDPDVINTPLPVEYGPAVEEEGGTVIRPEGSSSMTPLLVTHSMSQDASPRMGITGSPPQALKPTKLQRLVHLAQEVGMYRETLEPSWAEPVPAPEVCPGQWLQVPEHRSCSRSSSSSGSQNLKNKTKNLWNPTYGSWILESFGRGKTSLCHTQSMPLSCNPMSMSVPSSTSERIDPGVEVNTNVSTSPPLSAGSSQTTFSPTGPPSRKSPTGATGSSLAAVMDLPKLQSFPCGNVNYAYDEQSYETESLPVVVSKSVEPSTSSSATSSLAALGLATTFTHKPLDIY